jgi:hemolysin III
MDSGGAMDRMVATGWSGPPSAGPTVQQLDAYGPRPTWRGRIHLSAALIALPAAAWLLLRAQGTTATVAAAVYGLSLVGLFSVSATYHRRARTERAVKWMRRADHSMIFVLIAGTYTPVCLLVMPPTWGIPMLVAVWALALIGISLKMVRLASHGGSAASWLYIVLGWAAVLMMPSLVTRLDAGQLALLATGGVIYTVGAIGLGRRWPDPRPTVFGYHEVFHGMTVAAGTCHFVLILGLVA